MNASSISELTNNEANIFDENKEANNFLIEIQKPIFFDKTKDARFFDKNEEANIAYGTY